MIFEGKIAKESIPEFILKFRQTYIGKDLKKLIDLYYINNDFIEKQFNGKNIKELVIRIQSNLALTEPFIEYWINEDGRFQSLSMPAIEKGLILFSTLAYKGQLKNIEEIVDSFKELNYYKSKVKESYVRFNLINELIKRLKESDRTLKELQIELPNYDQQMIYEASYYLNIFEIIKREKFKSTYLLKFEHEL